MGFVDNFVGQGPGGGAGLQQPDFYVVSECWINMYFVGHVTYNVQPAGYLYAITGLPGVVPYPCVIINDQAGVSPDNPASAALMTRYRLLMHEVVCHYLKATPDHAGGGPCPANLCTDVGDFNFLCGGNQGATMPFGITDGDKTDICSRVAQFSCLGGS